MADLNTLMRLRPGYGQFLNQRNLVHRGEVVVFRANIRNRLFSTDAAGFRHTTLAGESFAVRDALQHERYGVVLGSSHIFGLGVSGDENTLPSLLSERFGFPFANASLPEGNSRNLFSLLTAFTSRAPRPPAIVVHFSGGDFTSFCYGGTADPVFGSPNLKQIGNASEKAASYPPAEETFPSLLAFTTLWTRSIVLLCRARGIPLVLGNDTTFFEKAEPSAFERECKLGSPCNALQRRWFPTHRQYFPQFIARREAIAANLEVPLAGPGARNELTFVDEFHYDHDGTRALAEDIAGAIQPLLSSA
jgi:hypothetical protein